MKKLNHFLWPQGKQHAITFSYDDGQSHDIQLIALLDKYSLKGTFNLNADNLGHEHFVRSEDLKKIYQNHEVATHSVTHPFPQNQPTERVFSEFIEDRRALENLLGKITKGMAYPFGAYNAPSIKAIAQSGILYGRTIKSHRQFYIPDNWFEWHPTCHDKMLDNNLIEKFFDTESRRGAQLFYIWGHSFEFPQQNRWDSFEEHLKLIAKHKEKYWAATNMEIYRYVEAARNLEFDISGTRVFNSSAQRVWLNVEGEVITVAAGQELEL